jgi:hypothetical protein
MRNQLLKKITIAILPILFLSSCTISELKESSTSTGGTEGSSTTSTTTTTKTTTSSDDSVSTGGTKTSTSTSTSSSNSSLETGGSEIEDDDEKTSTGGSKSSSSSSKEAKSYVLTPSSIGLTTTTSSKDDYVVSGSNIKVSFEYMYYSGTSFMMSNYIDTKSGGKLKIEAPDDYLIVGIKFSFPTDYAYTNSLRYEAGDKRYILDATYTVDGFSRSYAIKDDIDDIELLNISKFALALTSLEIILMAE